MRKLATTLALTLALSVVASSVAAAPQTGKFAGYTTQKPINGYHALVMFTSTGKTLKRFTVQTLGCFGYGQFGTGENPLGLPTATGRIALIPVLANGSFSITAKLKYDGSGTGDTIAVVAGTFLTPTSATGTVTIKQDLHGDQCAQKLKFTAQPGTPESLGLTGP